LWGDKWREAVNLCRSYLSDRNSFEEEEIAYKLRLVSAIREALDPEQDTEGFGQRLRRAFTNSENNLTNWQAHDRFTRWAIEEPNSAQEAVGALRSEGQSVEARVDGFLQRVPSEAVSGLGTRISIASYLLMGVDPENYPFYKPTPFVKVERLLGWPRTLEEESPGEVYAHHLRFVRRLFEELRRNGLEARDLLDVQSLIWFLATDEAPAVAVWRGESADSEASLKLVLSWVRNLRTQASPDGRFHYKPLVLLALLDLLDANPEHSNAFAYEEMLAAFEGRAAELGSSVTEDQFSQPYLRMRNDTTPLRVWVPQIEGVEEVDDAKADRPAYVRTHAPTTRVEDSAWPCFASPEGRAAIRQTISNTWAQKGQDQRLPWFEPLERPPGLEAALQSILERSNRKEQDLLAAVFRRAILLHQRHDAEGYLGAQPRNPQRFSITIGNAYACAAASNGRETLYLLVDDDPGVRQTYEAKDAPFSKNELMWIHGYLDRDSLQSLLEDEAVWDAYGRMLSKVEIFPLAHSNQNNRGKLSVISGRPYDSDFDEGVTNRPGRTLDDLADELLLEKPFLEKVVGLLRDKGQVIFYGPPGTGKTFVARKLTEYLAPEKNRREVVQFHPSYSYEDFVHGYRPVTHQDGTLAYELRPGPFMRLAQEASETPGEHVLLVDEINRGNLPKILGELLYLLEYREDEVALMYGEDGSRFSLPEDLLIIGTMNTADRSIALIDAAMRRRFHFVPFFPNERPLKELLRRWLERHRPGMVEVADIVERLNAELRERFGPHLQVGPSHFMKEDLDGVVLRRVWDYDVMPFLEDQLFGQEEELERFKLERLRSSENANHNAQGIPAEPGAPDAERGRAAPNDQEDR
jgi:MoxR-like ATPase